MTIVPHEGSWVHLNDRDCVDFLQCTLPRLGLHWTGLRKVRHILPLHASRTVDV